MLDLADPGVGGPGWPSVEKLPNPLLPPLTAPPLLCGKLLCRLEKLKVGKVGGGVEEVGEGAERCLPARTEAERYGMEMTLDESSRSWVLSKEVLWCEGEAGTGDLPADEAAIGGVAWLGPPLKYPDAYDAAGLANGGGAAADEEEEPWSIRLCCSAIR